MIYLSDPETSSSVLGTVSYLSAFAPGVPLPGLPFAFISSWDWNPDCLGQSPCS